MWITEFGLFFVRKCISLLLEVQYMINRSAFLKFFWCFVLFLSGTVSLYAQSVGCLSSNTTYTYINEEPTSVRNNHKTNNSYSSDERAAHVTYNRVFYHRYESDRKLTASNFCTTPIAGSCWIHSTRNDGGCCSSSPGTLVNYSTYNNCDLDGYDLFLLGALGLVSVWFIKKQFLLL